MLRENKKVFYVLTSGCSQQGKRTYLRTGSFPKLYAMTKDMFREAAKEVYSNTEGAAESSVLLIFYITNNNWTRM